MVNVWYYDLHSLDEPTFKRLLDILPFSMRMEVLQYKFFANKAAKLIGKLLIKMAIQETGYDADLIHYLKKSINGKPFIDNWLPFNLSYSKDLITIAFGGISEIGLDIESIEQGLDINSISNYFCTNEAALVKDHGKEFFFEIWTKKEAVSKAIGMGIANGLNHFDCTGNIVYFNCINWYLHKLNIRKNYVAYLATSNYCTNISIHEKLKIDLVKIFL